MGAEKDVNSLKFLWFDGTEVSFNATFWCKNSNLTEKNMNCIEYASLRQCAHNYYCDVDNVYPVCQKEMYMMKNSAYKELLLKNVLLVFYGLYFTFKIIFKTSI